MRARLSAERTTGTQYLLTSNCHAFFAALFDLFGHLEVALNGDGSFKYVRAKIADAPKPYLTQLRALYGGRNRKGVWTVEGEQAEAFAKAVRYFTLWRRRELELFLGACLSARAEGPLTTQQKRNRMATVEKLNAAAPKFELPRNFVKPVLWPSRSRSPAKVGD
jgi:hypothetical protein